MAPGALIPTLAGLVSLAFAGVVARQYAKRRRPFQLAWAAGLGAYALASLLDAWVVTRGWNAPLYWCYLLLASGNVGLLGLGTVYLLRAKAWGHAFAAFVALALATILAGAVALDPLPILTSAGPELGLGAIPSTPMGTLVRVAFILLSALGGLALIGGALWSGWQSRRAGVLLIGLGSLVVAAGGSAEGIASRMGSALVTASDARLLTQLAGIAIMFVGYLQGRESRTSPASPARGTDPTEG